MVASDNCFTFFPHRQASEQGQKSNEKYALSSLGRRVVIFHVCFLHVSADVLRMLPLPTWKKETSPSKRKKSTLFFWERTPLRGLCPLRAPNPPRVLFSSAISCSRQCLWAPCAVTAVCVCACVWSDATRHDTSIAHLAVACTSKLAHEASANPGRANPASMWSAKSEANMRARCGCPSTAAACAGVANALAMSMRMGPCALACAA